MEDDAAEHVEVRSEHVEVGPEHVEVGPGAMAEEEGLGYGAKALYNGRLLLTLSAGTACWDAGFEYSRCAERLAFCGLQVPSEELELLLRQALDTPEVRRYLCFNSALCLILLAPALYLVTWCSLFSSFHLLHSRFSQEYFVAFCLILSAAAVFITGAVVLVLHRQHGKISVNTEVRLTRANEILRSRHLLVGLSDRMEKCSSRLHLSFCYFDTRDCLKRLTHLLDGKSDSKRRLLATVKRKLGGLCVVVIQSGGVGGGGRTTEPVQGRDEDTDSEATPLLQTEPDENPGSPLTTPPCSVACCVAPAGTPKEVASQLLALYSALYVKLLATRVLPQTGQSLHAKEAGVPCLCQHIETALDNVCGH